MITILSKKAKEHFSTEVGCGPIFVYQALVEYKVSDGKEEFYVSADYCDFVDNMFHLTVSKLPMMDVFEAYNKEDDEEVDEKYAQKLLLKTEESFIHVDVLDFCKDFIPLFIEEFKKFADFEFSINNFLSVNHCDLP